MKKNNWKVKRVNKKRKLPIMTKEDKRRRFYAFMMRPRPYADKETYFCINWKTGECWYK